MYSISMSRTNCSVRLLATQGSEPALTRNTGLNDISAPQIGVWCVVGIDALLGIVLAGWIS